MEVRLLQSVPASVWNQWSVRVCVGGGPNCATVSLSAATLSANGFYLVFAKTLNSTYYDFGGMDMVLRDASGAAIDYVSIGNYSTQLSGLNCSTFPYPTTAGNVGNTFNVHRSPDGTGAWSFAPGNSYGSTEGETNDDDPPPGLDHIRLVHDGAGLTCASEAVHVKACADAACSALFAGPVEVSLGTAPPGGIWTPNPVTFSGETTVLLRFTDGGAVTLLAEATAPAATNPTQCENIGGGTPCEMVFAHVGVLLDGDGNDGIPKSDVPEQIAGKPSSVGYNAATQRVRVVRTDDETGACVAALQDTVLAAQFSYVVPDTAEGLSDNTLNILAASTATVTSAGAAESVDLEFGSDGSAPFSFQSMDAGRYALRVDMDIPVFDESDEPTGDVIQSHDTSNAFVVRPLAVYVEADGNPGAEDHDGPVFKRAGEPFGLAFRSLRWQPALDGSGDGRWDACVSPAPGLADPGVYARVPAWEINEPAPALVQPSGGVNPGLDYEAAVEFAAGASQATTTASFGEVGIIRFETSNGFLGAGVDVCSSNVGRFTPDHFDVTLDNTPAFAPACDGAFTYMSQWFEYHTAPEVHIAARNTDGQITRNYDGDWWRLPDLVPVYEHAGDPDPLPDDVVFTADGTHDAIDCSAGGCEGEVTVGFGGQFTYDRDGDPVNPVNGAVRVSFAVQDDDGIAYAGNPFGFTVDFEAGNDEQRWGRLEMQNAHGPELLPLVVPMYSTYFLDGAFRLNTDDNCTAISAGEIDLDIQLSGGTTSADVLNTPASAGHLNVSLSAPGAGNTGYVDVTPDLSVTTGADLPWLTFDWDGDGNPRGPEARATFGVFGGNERHIYIRELP